jgi:hypothetical protein
MKFRFGVSNISGFHPHRIERSADGAKLLAASSGNRLLGSCPTCASIGLGVVKSYWLMARLKRSVIGPRTRSEAQVSVVRLTFNRHTKAQTPYWSAKLAFRAMLRPLEPQGKAIPCPKAPLSVVERPW